MTASQQKKQEKVSDGVSIVAAAITGAVVGVIALSNENKVMGIQGEAEEKLAEGKEKAAKTVKTVTKAKKEVKSIWQK